MIFLLSFEMLNMSGKIVFFNSIQSKASMESNFQSNLNTGIIKFEQRKIRGNSGIVVMVFFYFEETFSTEKTCIQPGLR